MTERKVIVIERSDLLEQVERALTNRRSRQRAAGQPEDKTTPEAWLKEHSEDLQDEVHAAIPHLVNQINMTYEERMVTKPVLEFRREHGFIRLYAYRAGQACHVGEHKQFHFGHDGSAGLVYDDQSGMGHHANDVDVDNASTWQWIQKWMTKGMQAEGILPKEQV